MARVLKAIIGTVLVLLAITMPFVDGVFGQTVHILVELAGMAALIWLIL